MQGTQVHAENPMACYPSVSHVSKGRCAYASKAHPQHSKDAFPQCHLLQTCHLNNALQVCHHCLKPVGNRHDSQAQACRFCSAICSRQASHDYFAVEQQLNLTALQQHCQAYGESFPLLAARAACQHLQQALPVTNGPCQPPKAAPGGSIPQGDLWQVQDRDTVRCEASCTAPAVASLCMSTRATGHPEALCQIRLPCWRHLQRSRVLLQAEPWGLPGHAFTPKLQCQPF